MARPRKIKKRVSIEIEIDVTSLVDYRQIKDDIKSLVQSNLNGELVYLAIVARTRNSSDTAELH